LSALALARGEHLPAQLRGGSVDWPRAWELRHVRAVAEQTRPGVPGGLAPAAAARAAARSAWAHGELGPAARAWPDDGAPLAPLDALMRAEALAAAADPAADAALAALDGVRTPTEIAYVRARMHLKRGEVGPGRAALVAALDAWQTDPWGHGPVLERGLALLRAEAAVDPRLAAAAWERTAAPWPVSVLEEYRHQLRISLALALDAADGGARCADAFGAMEPHVPWSLSLLGPRAACYARVGSPLAAGADADLRRFLADRPAPLHAGLLPPRP